MTRPRRRDAGYPVFGNSAWTELANGGLPGLEVIETAGGWEIRHDPIPGLTAPRHQITADGHRSGPDRALGETIGTVSTRGQDYVTWDLGPRTVWTDRASSPRAGLFPLVSIPLPTNGKETITVTVTER